MRDAAQPAAAPAKTAEPVRLQFQSLPQTFSELQSMPEAALKTPQATAALTVMALCVWPTNREEAKRMLAFLSGPRTRTNMDWQFIADRFMDGVDYVPRSYFEGATPENDYTPDRPYTLLVYDDPNGPVEENYSSVMLKSGGADSKRKLTLRKKPSTGQYFLWEQYLLSGIRKPVSRDEWA
ncbi:MAG: hypothetical protein K6G54_05200 [Oscillospiraceae bacterium]|nr:hypothetical protein [Oscillospiraceae bacterium]